MPPTEYYTGEGREVAVRLDIPRGTYALRFVPAEVVSKPSDVEEISKPPVELGKEHRMRPFLAGITVGVAVLAVALEAWQIVRARGEAERERGVLTTWGPMLERGGSVTIAIGTPVSLFVRDFGDAEAPLGDPPYWLDAPRTPEFVDWYKRTRGLGLGKTAILHPNAHSPLWGDAAAAAVVSRMMGEHGVMVEVMPSARVHPVALRDKNAVVIGRVEYTDAIRAFQPEDGLAIEYSAKDRKVGVRNRAPKKGEPEWWFATGRLRHNYGLITVVPSDVAARKRTIVFSGINSDGAEAGARYFTSSEKLKELAEVFRKAGVAGWPPHYQVVVRTESLDTYSLQTKFEYLRILK